MVERLNAADPRGAAELVLDGPAAVAATEVQHLLALQHILEQNVGEEPEKRLVVACLGVSLRKKRRRRDVRDRRGLNALAAAITVACALRPQNYSARNCGG